MRRSTLGWVLLFAVGLRAQGLDVDVDVEELKSHVGQTVVFTNFEGTHEVVNSAEEIRAIGIALAASLLDKAAAAGLQGRYSVAHAVGTEESEGLYADIISIDSAAKVDHIDNVRRIISGFLEAAYDFSRTDSDLIAVFATYYNAIFRGNMEYLSYNYTRVVLEQLDERTAGISTLYSDWPAATKLLIPLSHRVERGRLSSLDTSALTDEQVIDEMRKTEDRSVDTRKDMVDLKERQVEEMKSEIEVERQELQRERAALEEEKKQIEAAKAEPPDTPTAEQAPAAQPIDQQPIDQQPTAQPDERELAAREEAIKEREEEITAAEEVIAAKEEEIKAKEEEIDADREEIQEDEVELDRQPTIAVAMKPEPDAEPETAAEREPEELAAAFLAENVYYLRQRVDGSEPPTSTLSVIDPVNDTIIETSSVEHIAGTTYVFFGERILVIAHADGPRSPAHLVLLDPRTLEPIARAEREVYPDASFVIQSHSIYTVLKDGETYTLGMFDEELELVEATGDSVLKDTMIVLFNDKLYATSASGDILVLDRTRLTTEWILRVE